jgi:hypothetical protein
MSNKSPIYGFCDAGCRRETVHKADFDRAATYIEIGLNNGAARVEPFHKYKIKTNIVDGAYACTVKILVNNNDDSVEISEPYELDIPITKAFDKYRDHFYIEVLAWDYVSEETYNLIYELNGEQQTFGYTTTEDLTLGGILIANATEVYRYNADAEILAKDGKDGRDGKDGKDGLGVPKVTADDNGKVLRVAGGAWAAVDDAIPTYDLSVLGLSAIAPNGEHAVVETDTTDILAALNKGAVKFIVKFNIGTEIEISLVMSPACVTASGEYSCSSINEFNDSMMITTISAADGGISVKCTPMDNIIGAYINIALGGDY